jgi:hypothetical protein
LKAFRKQGFETANKRVIVPHTKTETAKINKGQVAIKSKTGIERIQLPVEYYNLRQYLSDLKKNAALIQRMKRDNEYFGIRFFGGQRAMFYSDINDLLEDLDRYDVIEKRTSVAKQAEIYRNLEILKMNRFGAEGVEAGIIARKSKMSKEYNKKHAKILREKYKRNPAKHAAIREAANKRAREYRARIKGPKLKHYRKLARQRAKKSRDSKAKKSRKNTTRKKRSTKKR